jgi:hypothetical protein
MRAFLLATIAVCALAACGAPTPAATDGAGQGSPVSPTKTAPEPPSVIAEPTPPGGNEKPRDPSTSEPPVTIGPNGPVLPEGVSEVPASQIDASALLTYYEYGNKVWMFDGGFSLQLFAEATSSCAEVEAVLADQSADSVKIMVRSSDQPQGGRPDDKMCASVMTPKPVVVRLDTPLQDRKILLSSGR